MPNHNRYTATKEEAERLRDALADAVPLEQPGLKTELLAFLGACIKRLPRIASIDRDRLRRAEQKLSSAQEETSSGQTTQEPT